MQNIDKALAEITDIRNQIAAGRMFKGFSPAVIGLTGLFALMLAGAQTIWPSELAANSVSLLGWWIFAALLSVILIGIEMLSLSRRHHGGLADSMITNTVKAFLPIGAAGAVIALVILKHHIEFAWVLPGIWQLLIAIGTFSAMQFLPKYVGIVGAWYFLAGTIVLLIGQLSPWSMAVPFAVGQGLMAIILFKTLETSA